MKTVTIQIGNSDDKLTQKEWAYFVLQVGDVIRGWASQVHFFGTSEAAAEWQNAAWVFEIEADDLSRLKRRVSDIRGQYRQDSVVWTEGDTSFI